jgi:hypothetical protein
MQPEEPETLASLRPNFFPESASRRDGAMPKKQPSIVANSSGQPDGEFQCWLNHAVFYSDDPLYRIYTKLRVKGCAVRDLAYIDFLRRSLEAWDNLSPELSRKTHKLDLSRLPANPPGIVQMFGLEMLNAITRAQKADRTLSLSEEIEQFINEPWTRIVQGQREARSLQRNSFQGRIRTEAADRFPFFVPFFDAVNVLYKVRTTGRKSDPAGKLLTLAVSQRLKASNIHGAQALAGDLLAKVRKQQTPKRSTIAERMSEFRNSYRKWKSIFKQLDQGFRQYAAAPLAKRNEERKLVRKVLAEGQFKKGDVVSGPKPPHGGTWSYDPQKNELTLIQEPTRHETQSWNWE